MTSETPGPGEGGLRGEDWQTPTVSADVYWEACNERDAAMEARTLAEQEVERLRRALAGHLFDGESVSTREAIRSELIQQGTLAEQKVARVKAALAAHAFGIQREEWRESGHNGCHDVIRVDAITLTVADPEADR